MSLGRGLAGLLLLVLAGCGGGPPPPPPAPTLVSLTLKATADVNPDAAGIAKPVKVKVLQLATGGSLPTADFFALNGDVEKALGKDVKGVAEFVVAPNGTQVWQGKLDEGVKVIGVVAAYFAYDKVNWRAWKEVPPNATTLLTAELSAQGVALREAAP